MIIDRRKRILIFIAICLVVLFLFALMLSALFKKEPVPEVLLPEQQADQVQVVPSEPEISPIETQKRDGRIESASLNSLAKTFAERYGSYSNEAKFQNLRDLLPFMSGSFVEKTQLFIDTTPIPEEYYGVTTRVVAVDVKVLDETAGTATIELTVQREEAKESPENRTITYALLRLEFVMEEGSWKVSSATWL